MPCGGIFSTVYGRPMLAGSCFQCGKWTDEWDGLFVEEWDAVIHRECLGLFLCSEEGKVVMEHGHAIQVEEKQS